MATPPMRPAVSCVITLPLAFKNEIYCILFIFPFTKFMFFTVQLI